MLAVSILSFSGCSDGMKKGSFRKLSYSDPLNSQQANSVKTDASNRLDKYTSFEFTYYDLHYYHWPSDETATQYEIYITVSAKVIEDDNVTYSINTSNKTTKNGKSSKEIVKENHVISVSYGVIKDTVTINGETEMTLTSSTQKPKVYVLSKFLSLGSINFSWGDVYLIDTDFHIVTSSVSESQEPSLDGSFEVISISRIQMVIILNSIRAIENATYYRDYQTNIDPLTGRQGKSVKEVARTYAEIKLKN